MNLLNWLGNTTKKVEHGANNAVTGVGHLIGSTVGTPVEAGRLGLASLTHNQPAAQAATQRFQTNAQNSIIGPLARVAQIEGTNLAAPKVLSNPGLTPQQKQNILSQSYAKTGLDVNKPLTLGQGASIVGQAALTPLYMRNFGTAALSKPAQVAIPALKFGAVGGAQSGLGALENPNATPGSVLKAAGSGFATTAALGAAFPLAGAGIKAGAKGANKVLQSASELNQKRIPLNQIGAVGKNVSKEPSIPGKPGPLLQAWRNSVQDQTLGHATKIHPQKIVDSGGLNNKYNYFTQGSGWQDKNTHPNVVNVKAKSIINQLYPDPEGLGLSHISKVKDTAHMEQLLQKAVKEGNYHTGPKGEIIPGDGNMVALGKVPSSKITGGSTYTDGNIPLNNPSKGSIVPEATIDTAKLNSKGRVTVSNGNSSASLVSRQENFGGKDYNILEIKAINSTKPKTGSATQLLNDIKAHADKEGKVVYLEDKATPKSSYRGVPNAPESPMAQKDLTAWYERNGFKRLKLADGSPSQAMVYKPKTAQPTQVAKTRLGLKPLNEQGFARVPGKGPKQEVPTPEQNLSGSLANNTLKPQTRGTIKTLKSSPSVSPEVQSQIKGTKFTPRPHAPMRAAAEASVSKDLTAATEKAYKDLNQTPGRITDTQQMNAIKVAQAHDQLGNHEMAANIYSRLATHRTRVAQALAVGQELSKRTPDGIRYAAQKVLQDNKVPFEGKVRSDVESLMKNIRSTKIGTPEREIATQKLIDRTNQYIPRTKTQATIDLWRAGLLTGPETVAKIASSHLITSPMESLVRPVTALTDKVVSKAPKPALNYLTRGERGVIAGDRTVTFSPKDIGSAFKGLVEGGKAGVQHVKTGIDMPNTGGFAKELGTGHHQTAYERGVYRVHGSVYKPFFRSAYKVEEANQQRLAKAKFGNDKAKIDAFMKNDKTQQKMHDYAAQYAMQNQTEAGKITQNIQHIKVGGIPVGEWIAPFSRIPAALGVKGIVDYTPIGTLRAAKTVIDGIKKGTFDQRKFSESLSKSAGGGTALVAAGGLLMSQGRMTLQEPSDPKERQLWIAQGKTRNSIKIGNKWVSLNGTGPVGIALGVGGAFERAIKGGAGGENAIAQAVGAGTKLIADQPYMQGLSNVTGALQDPARKASSYINRSITSFIPAAVQQTARGTDTSQRAYNPSLSSQLKLAVPGSRGGQPAQHDIFGNVVSGQGKESGRVGGIVNPLYPSTAHGNDPATQELQRLYNVLGTKSAAIQPTTYYTDKNGKRVNLTVKQQQDMLVGTGPSIQGAINKLVQNQSYQSLDNAGKVSKINDVINAYQNQYLKVNLNPDQKVTSTQTKLMTTDLTNANLAKKVKGPKSSVPSATTTTFDPKTNIYTQTSATGKVTKITPDGVRTVVSKGLGTISGANPNWTAQIRASASKYGVDPNATIAVAAMEGLGGGVGDNGTSYGPFQLHAGGALPQGKNQAWAESPAGIDYAVQQISKVAKGKTGQDAVQAIVNAFEKPLDPNSEIAGAVAILTGKNAKLTPGQARSIALTGSSVKTLKTLKNSTTLSKYLSVMKAANAAVKPPKTPAAPKFTVKSSNIPSSYKRTQLKKYSVAKASQPKARRA